MQVEDNLTLYENNEDKSSREKTNVEFPEKFVNIINNIIIKEGYQTYDVKRKIVSTNGGNYFGVLYEIDVKGNTVNGAKETNIFVKNMVSNVENMTLMSIPQAYKIETFAYKELSNVFDELQDEAEIPTEERFKMVKSFEEGNSETIILENVTRKGYTTLNRLDVMSLKYAEKAVTLLAKFHALSFVMKERIPQFFHKNIETAKTPLIFDEYWHPYVNSLSKQTLNCLDDDLRYKFEEVFPRIIHQYPRYIEDVSIISCLCHGDYRQNNIMMKEVNGEVVDLIPIDYQLMHYGCPVQDFLYFLYTGTDKAFRDVNFSYLKNLYYDSVRKFLEYFDINAETVFPKAEFEETLKKRMDYALMITLIFGPFIFADENYVPDYTEDKITTVLYKFDDVYKDRLRDAVQDYIDYGFLEE